MRKLRVVVIGVVIMLVTAPVSGQSTTRVPFDYTAGGLIPAANCIQAFDPWAIQDLSQSYVDLGLHGNDAIVTVPPTLVDGGWQFDGVGQFVSTGLTLSNTCTMAVYYSIEYVTAFKALYGTNEWYFQPHRVLSGSAYLYYGGQSTNNLSALDSGVVVNTSGFDADDAFWYCSLYRNGSLWLATGVEEDPSFSETILLGCRNGSSFIKGIIARWSLYNIRLSAAQAAALSAEMAEYNEIETPPSSPTLLDGFAPANIFTTASDVFNALWSVIAIVAGIALGFGVLSMILARLRR